MWCCIPTAVQNKLIVYGPAAAQSRHARLRERGSDTHRCSCTCHCTRRRRGPYPYCRRTCKSAFSAAKALEHICRSTAHLVRHSKTAAGGSLGLTSSIRGFPLWILHWTTGAAPQMSCRMRTSFLVSYFVSLLGTMSAALRGACMYSPDSEGNALVSSTLWFSTQGLEHVPTGHATTVSQTCKTNAPTQMHMHLHHINFIHVCRAYWTVSLQANTYQCPDQRHTCLPELASWQRGMHVSVLCLGQRACPCR